MTISKSVSPKDALEMIDKFILSDRFKETSFTEKKLILITKAKLLIQLGILKLSKMENQAKKPLYFYGTKQFTVKKNKTENKVVRRFTLAGVIGNDGVINVGRAVCSENDQFVKSTARKIATGRAGKKPINLIKVKEGETPQQAFLTFSRKHVIEGE